MRTRLRKLVFALPFGCLVAVATHFVRFGEDHAFGGDANEGLIAGAVGGSVVIAFIILHAFLTSSTTITTGTLAAARARLVIPGAPAIFVFAASLYYGIETLEGNGIELGLPTLLLAILAVIVAFTLRRITAIFARFVADLLRDWLARLDRRERRILHFARRSRRVYCQIARTARRFGRAPPEQQRSSTFAVS